MNKGMNLPAIQRIMAEFDKENGTMELKETMMSDAVDDVMATELEDEEEEGDKILKEVLDEIGVDLSQQVRCSPSFISHDKLKRIANLDVIGLPLFIACRGALRLYLFVSACEHKTGSSTRGVRRRSCTWKIW